MASTNKQLLGTEATRALRANGCKAKICGLSANDCEEAFIRAGANAFMLKPITTNKEQLGKELFDILCTKEGSSPSEPQET